MKEPMYTVLAQVWMCWRYEMNMFVQVSCCRHAPTGSEKVEDSCMSRTALRVQLTTNCLYCWKEKNIYIWKTRKQIEENVLFDKTWRWPVLWFSPSEPTQSHYLALCRFCSICLSSISLFCTCPHVLKVSVWLCNYDAAEPLLRTKFPCSTLCWDSICNLAVVCLCSELDNVFLES